MGNRYVSLPISNHVIGEIELNDFIEFLYKEKWGWVCIGLLGLLGFMIYYTAFVSFPESLQEKALVKQMDCKTIKKHLSANDLKYTSQESLEGIFIGRCS